MQSVSRRTALQAMGSSMAAMSLGSACAQAGESSARQTVSVGIVADVHQDIIHDGLTRIKTFVNRMNQRKPEYVIQLGDFALPGKGNHSFLDAWSEFEGPRYHVLGNHDAERGFTREQTMKWWGMERPYYSIDVKGWHFVVLNGNDANPRPWSGYHRYIAAEQLDWLKGDLAGTSNPTLVYSHQSLEETTKGVANGDAVRQVLEQANRDAGRRKVFTCLSGHHHTDYMKTIAGIHYIQINSMSYKWLGGKYQARRFSAEIEKAHPTVRNTAPYRDPLFTTMTLDAEANTLSLEGCKSTLIPPTPTELGVPHAEEITATITARQLAID